MQLGAHGRKSPEPLKGRGANDNLANRFEPIHYIHDEEYDESQDPLPNTEFFKDTARSVISYNDSPDIGFRASVNPYRGCEHGCIYCYARPTHEYFGLSAGLDFESKIFVKENAPQLLAKELSKKSWQPQVVVMSGVTDCYQPIERRLKITRGCLEVLRDFCNPVAIITKNHLVTRDIDILSDLAKVNCVAVFISVTSLDADLAQKMEPRASQPQDRLLAIKKLHDAGIPVGSMVAPIIPGLTDHEIPMILKAIAEAGAQTAGHTIVSLPWGVKELFPKWLEQHFPDRKEKVLNRIRDIRGGKLNDPRFGTRMSGEGVFAENIHNLFAVACRKVGLPRRGFDLSTKAFRNPNQQQFTLF